MIIDPSVFRMYDIRGIKDTQITAEFAELLGRALVARFSSSQVVIGYDARPSSIAIAPHLIEGLTKQGADVVNLGMVPTELVPITAGLQNSSEAIIITASHNPAEFVGFKLFTEHGMVAIVDDAGRKEIQAMITHPETIPSPIKTGTAASYDPWPGYLKLIHSLVPLNEIQKSFSILADAGNGMGGAIVEHVLQGSSVTVEPLLFEPDGTYPNHIPNPILPEARALAESKAKQVKYDFTIMLDGDGDRAAFLDEDGVYVPSDYFDTLIMDHLMHEKYPDSPIVIDYRKGWTTFDSGKAHNYKVMQTMAGYPNIKRAMRQSGAAFGYEASSHTMYKDTFYSESSGLTLLSILQILSQTGQSLKQLVAPYRERVKMIDEQNYLQSNSASTFEALKTHFARAANLSYEDGVIITATDWHASVRQSNTEPFIRLNIEARSQAVLDEKYKEIEQIMLESGAKKESYTEYLESLKHETSD